MQAFIGSFVRPHGLDVAAAPLVAAAIAELARTGSARAALGVAVRLLRGALLVPTALATTSAVIGGVLHRFRPPLRDDDVAPAPR